MYGGTTGRHVASHGADPARPGGAPVDPTLGHLASARGGPRKAADMHCAMMSDHDLPVVVNPFN